MVDTQGIFLGGVAEGREIRADRLLKQRTLDQQQRQFDTRIRQDEIKRLTDEINNQLDLAIKGVESAPTGAIEDQFVKLGVESILPLRQMLNNLTGKTESPQQTEAFVTGLEQRLRGVENKSEAAQRELGEFSSKEGVKAGFDAQKDVRRFRANKALAKELGLEVSDAQLAEALEIIPESGGVFGSNSLDSNFANLLITTENKLQQGIEPTDQEKLGVAIAAQELAKPEIITLPDGRVIERPGVDLGDFKNVQSLIGGGAITTGEEELGTEPKSVQEAGTIAGLETSQADLKIAEDIFFPKGTFDRAAALAAKTGTPGTQGRDAGQAIRRSVDTIIRLKTGAAAPAQELNNLTGMFTPSALDSDKGARAKLDALGNFLNIAAEELGADPVKAAEEALKAAGFEPASGEENPFKELSEDELKAIDPSTLSIEELDAYIEALEALK